MTDLYVEGPDVIRLLSDLAINSFNGYGRNKGKQLVCCNHEGYLIGDMVLFGLEDRKVNIVGRPPVANWIQYHAETGNYDVKVERDERSVSNPKPRKTYRFELQGPNAWALLEKLNGAPLAPLKFFNMGEIRIARRTIRALAHGFAGEPGLEFWDRPRTAPKSKPPLSRRERSLVCDKSEVGPTAACVWRPAGSPRRCRRFTPA